MAKIQFRAYDKINKRMTAACVFIDCNGESWQDQDKYGVSMDGKCKIAYTDKFEIMQHTGCDDYLGRAIYESDIVKVNWLAELGITEIDCEANGVIKWDKDEAKFYVELLNEFKSTPIKDMEYNVNYLPLFNRNCNDNFTYILVGNIYETKLKNINNTT